MRTLASSLGFLRAGLPLLLLASCGGKVTIDNSSGTGSGGATTSGTTAAHGSSGLATSAIGTTVAASTGSGPPPDSCVNFGFNGIGAPCSMEGTHCVVPFACCAMQAFCKGGIWTASGPTCQQLCITCGPPQFGCQGGAVCVEDSTGFGQPSYRCAKDPCPPGQLSCACAKSVCQQNYLSCAGTSQETVHCDCPNCAG